MPELRFVIEALIESLKKSIYVLVLIHMLHFIAGIITLIVVTYNSHFKVYNNQNKIGFELATIFWHFLDILWIYLYVFVVAIN